MRNPFRRREPDFEFPADLDPATKARLEALAQNLVGALPSAAILSVGGGMNRDTPEAREALLSFAATYGRCPFRVGQWITRREGTMGHGQGWPHLVIEVAATPHRNFYLDGNISPDRDPDYGARYDCRVLHQNSKGEVHAHWVESWLFEPMTDFAEVPQPEGDA